MHCCQLTLEQFLAMQRKMQNGIELSPVVDRFILHSNVVQVDCSDTCCIFVGGSNANKGLLLLYSPSKG